LGKLLLFKFREKETSKMNTVSLNKTRSLTAVRVASLLALAALAIAFFAFPFASYAMGCKGGSKNKKANNPVVAGTVQFADLMEDTPTTTNTLRLNGAKLVTPVIPTETMTLITPDKVTGMFVWNWVKGTFNGKEVYGTIADTKGDVWLTNGAFVKLTGLPDGIKIKSAPKGVQPLD
jgi:hypothetical protein